jgi:RNA ligase (TIGR02306 family)
LGELFGPGVQDLHYGQLQRKFRFFDVACRPLESRNNKELHWGNSGNLKALVSFIDRVPVLYEGPYKPEILKMLTDGWETVSGKAGNVREGVVVRTLPDRFVMHGLPCDGRVQLKSVSDAYLFRGGEQTEFA